MSNTTTDAPAPAENAEAKAAEQTEDSLLTQLQADLERFRDLALRTQADFENFRKRAAREKEDAIKYATASFLERLIPILDNFELGLNAARTSAANSPILAGMDMVAKQLSEFLTASGFDPLNAEAQPFHPNLHHASAPEATPPLPHGV